MTQAEIVALIQNVHEQYAVLFAQALTVSFAVIVATYYFLHRTSARFRVAVLFTYLVGMLAVSGQMLQQANLKRLAVGTLEALPVSERAGVAQGVLDLQGSWLFRGTGVLQNASLWMLVGIVAYMLFWWRPAGGTADDVR
jgi:hypothetical protein